VLLRDKDRDGDGQNAVSALHAWFAAEKRELAFHLVSAHRDPLVIARPYEENRDQHHHGHRGLGTHRPGDYCWDPEKLEEVLEEAEHDA